ncbi:MAG: hypothetical protein ACK53T_12220 [Planctomycetota bacterium]
MRPMPSRVLQLSLFAISACAAGDPILGGGGPAGGAASAPATEQAAHRAAGGERAIADEPVATSSHAVNPVAGGDAHGPAAAAPAATAATAILHGHNDYLQPAPLQRALALGLGSVEADVFLEGGELRVGHERWQLRAGRTLRAHYLEPLRAHVAAHGTESLSRDPLRPFVLLVDIKADGDAVYRALRAELADFAPMLTRFVDGCVERNAVTVILSGSRPRALLAAERDRWCALDGRLPDLDAVPPPPADLVPWISDAWSRVSDWTGTDELTAAERARLASLATRARAQGRELRFWGAPDRPEAWQALRELGIARVGTDRPTQAARWAVGAGDAPE